MSLRFGTVSIAAEGSQRGFILPICKDNPVSRIQWVVFTLIVVNTIALAITYIFYTSEVVFR